MDPVHKQWHRRGYLPHFDAAGVYQVITYRLADAMPARVVQQLEKELPALDDSKRDRIKRERIEAWMDAGHGASLLGREDCARVVQQGWFMYAGERYDLCAWVVMPNHVHVLIRQYEGCSLGSIIRSWKGSSARSINQLCNRTGPLWHADYFDRFIRDERHFFAAQHYIHQNPVSAGLVDQAESYEASSAALLAAPGG